jgi:hypothetical protein
VIVSEAKLLDVRQGSWKCGGSKCRPFLKNLSYEKGREKTFIWTCKDRPELRRDEGDRA